MLGQSNALGWGVGADEPAAEVPDPRIWQWPGSGPSVDTVVPAVDPLVGPFTASGVGPVMSFARAYAADHDREVLIVQAAVGGTGFAPAQGMTWDPDLHDSVRNLYDEAVAQVRDALAEGAGNRLVAVLWVQGESDVGRISSQQYTDGSSASSVAACGRRPGAVRGRPMCRSGSRPTPRAWRSTPCTGSCPSGAGRRVRAGAERHDERAR